MTVSCPACGNPNPGGSIFCIRCGEKMQPTSTSNTFAYQQQQQSQTGPQPGNQQQSQTGPQPGNQQQSQTVPQPGNQQQSQMGTVAAAVTGEDQWQYRHAFAGYGIPMMHHSWLLDGEHHHASALSQTIMELLRQRSFFGFKLNSKNLKERGYQTENRNYIIAQRGVSTVFIYTAPAGKDLYISRTTTVRPIIDFFRVLTLCILIAIALFGPGILGSMAANANSTGGNILAGFLSGIVGVLSIPIWIYLFIQFFRSFRYWMAENDFWVYLRAKDLNDFQLDDIALLEHATDETVLAAVKQLHLDASKIVPPSQGYRPERRVRAI